MRFAFCLMLLFCLPVHALEVRFYPSDRVYLFETNTDRNLNSALIQSIGVMQDQDAEITLDSVTVEVLSGGQPQQSLYYRAVDLESAAKKFAGLQQQGLLKLYDFQFPISRFLGKDVVLSATPKLARGSAILIPYTFLEVKGTPDSIRVRVHGTDTSGKPAQAEASLSVVNYKSSVEYDFPLRGTWYVGASATPFSHHRWAVNEEFALDLGQLGAGGLTHKGMGTASNDYYCFGQDVLAAADGTVVDVVDQFGDEDSKLKQENESYDQFNQRIVMEQMQMLQQDPYSVTGNRIVIKHADSEYSFYAHLKKGSIVVKKGDSVKRGQVIAAVGNSGNTTEPHLHFHIEDGADPLYSRGIPVRFRNVTVEIEGYQGRQLQSGWIVTAR